MLFATFQGLVNKKLRAQRNLSVIFYAPRLSKTNKNKSKQGKTGFY